MQLARETVLHTAFEWSLLGKAAFAFVETVGGFLVYFVSQQFLFDLASTVTQNELTGDPGDFVGNYLLHLAENYSLGAQHFAAIYLVSHGVIKLGIIIGLLRNRLWAYPTALAVFTLFIAYQLLRYMSTHSFWLLVITVFDLFVIALTWHEYRYMARARAISNPSPSQGSGTPS